MKACDDCHRQLAISQRHELPITTILEVELLNMRVIDFMSPSMSFVNYKYILVEVDYMSK